MIVSFPADPFRRAFAVAIAVVPSRTPKPVLSSVLLSVSDAGPARLLASDLEMWLSVDVPALGDGPGRVLLPAERTRAILGSLPKGSDLSLAAEAGSLTLRSGGACWTFTTEDPDLYPTPPDVLDPAGTIPAGELLRGIRRTIGSSDPESTRYALGGVCLELRPDGCRAVATDGRRLASQVMTAPGEWAGVPETPVVPIKACKVLERLLGGLEPDAPIAVAFEGSRAVHFAAEGFLLFSRLLEGRFPAWRDVFPKEDSLSVRVHVGSFRAAVAQARIVQSPESRGVLLRVDGAITLSAQTAEVGTARAECPLDGDGFAEPIEVTLGGDYLGEALGVLDEDGSIDVRIVDPKSPIVLADDTGATLVVMPMSKD